MRYGMQTSAARLDTTESYLAEILGSTSWRVTYPLRRSIEILRAPSPPTDARPAVAPVPRATAAGAGCFRRRRNR